MLSEQQSHSNQPTWWRAREICSRLTRDPSYRRSVARPSSGLTVLRVIAGGVFIVSGEQKLFQVGIDGVAHLFGSLQLPLPFMSALGVTLVELFGGAALVLGLFTRWAAALLAMDMLVAVLVVYFEPAFFKTGIQFPLTLLAVCITFVLSGPGTLSLDGVRGRRS
jgi:putative oxidoreductase